MTPRRVFRMRCQVTPQAGHARCPGQTARTITSGLRAGRTRSCAMPGGKASAPGRTPASMPCVAAWTRSAFRSPNAGGPNARPNCRISRIGPEPGLTANQPPSQIAAQGRKIARWSAPCAPLNGSQRRSGRVDFSAESPFLLDFEHFGPNPGRSGHSDDDGAGERGSLFRPRDPSVSGPLVRQAGRQRKCPRPVPASGCPGG